MTPQSPHGLRAGAAMGMARVVLRRPPLWFAALAALRRMAAPGWWRRSPFLPVPDPRLWDFRMVTAYGRADADPQPSDVISYLQWCRSTVGHRQIGWEVPDPPHDRIDRTVAG